MVVQTVGQESGQEQDQKLIVLIKIVPLVNNPLKIMQLLVQTAVQIVQLGHLQLRV